MPVVLISAVLSAVPRTSNRHPLAPATTLVPCRSRPMKTVRIVILLCLTTIVAPMESNAEAGGVQTGEYRISSTLAQVAGESSARFAAEMLPPDEPISWQVYVPDAYRADNPPGLLVYISPSPSGEIPRGWGTVMDDHNLIWVAANGSGNSVMAGRRALFSVIAPTLIGKRYKIDRERIYLSGLSGGGRMASRVATDNAHLFKGAIYNSGADFWGREPPQRYEQIKQNNYVFITGTLDQALEPTKKVYKKYRKAGIENIKLMVIRNMTHENPSRFKFSEAITFLDSRLDNPTVSPPGENH